MDTEYKAKSFKSGNSVAIRLPAALGIKPELEWVVTVKDGELIIRAADTPRRKIDIDKIRGCLKGSGLRYLTAEERIIHPRPSELAEPRTPATSE